MKTLNKKRMLFAQWVKELRKCSLKELRRRQDLCFQQEEIAGKLKNTPALERLQFYELCLAEAVNLEYA